MPNHQRVGFAVPPQKVKAIKTWLEAQFLLCKDIKISPVKFQPELDGPYLDYMYIPTTVIEGSTHSFADVEHLAHRFDLTTTPWTGEELMKHMYWADAYCIPQSSNGNILYLHFKRFLTSLSIPSDVREALLASIPKRWSLYPPMVLFPPGALASDAWQHALAFATAEQKEMLWRDVVLEITQRSSGNGGKRTSYTHLAINKGIPLAASSDTSDDNTPENILRSPSKLTMLLGDFGPDVATSRFDLSKDNTDPIGQKDFDSAFWVSCTQNGLTQYWAPKHTMFSRGNVKEKARVLSFPLATTYKQDDRIQLAVDLYAGIGYFTLSYLKLGYRVAAWEINPFSVEGLRRGAEANGFASCDSVLTTEQTMRTDSVSFRSDALLQDGNTPTVTVFQEGNEEALDRLLQLRETCGSDRQFVIRHVNLGFLPSSQSMWETAIGLLLDNASDSRSQRLQAEGWAHVHENVAAADVDVKKAEIEKFFHDEIVRAGCDKWVRAECRHVEMVKTFAPGVWHVVYDIWVGPV
jgi:tRNA wybutosine-synthesizing protein 2